MAQNGPQVAEGGYTQTLKRSTDMENTNDVPGEEQTSRLQQPAVGGSLPIRGIMGFLKWVQAERFIWYSNHGRWLRGDQWPPKGSDFLTDDELFEQWFGQQ